MATCGRAIPDNGWRDFEATGEVVAIRTKPVTDVRACRDLVWLFLSNQGFGGTEIARICQRAARQKDHINRRLQEIRREHEDVSSEKAG